MTPEQLEQLEPGTLLMWVIGPSTKRLAVLIGVERNTTAATVPIVVQVVGHTTHSVAWAEELRPATAAEVLTC